MYRTIFEEPDHSVRCDCCGGKTTALTRFVNRNGEQYAVYLGHFFDCHPGEFVTLLAGFGDWSDDADPLKRTAFAFRIRNTPHTFETGLVDAEMDGWETDLLGRRLTRAEALVHPLKQELFGLADHIMKTDRSIINYLDRRA